METQDDSVDIARLQRDALGLVSITGQSPAMIPALTNATRLLRHRRPCFMRP